VMMVLLYTHYPLPTIECAQRFAHGVVEVGDAEFDAFQRVW
jgi:hypothetical protein